MQGDPESLEKSLGSTLLPFLVWGPLIKTKYQEKGYPYYYGVTGDPGASTRDPTRKPKGLGLMGFRVLGFKGFRGLGFRGSGV